MTNYIAKAVEFKEVNRDTFIIKGKTYKVKWDKDPEYINDGILDISYWDLYDTDDEETEYVLAFDKRENPEVINEWADEYDTENMYVLALN